MDGLTTLQSNSTPQETMDRFEAEVKAHGMTIFGRVDHAALAQQVGLTLRPTELLVFGNPRGGTPLMQANQTIGIDLPLKALVWQDAAGKTWLSYNEPAWLAERHEIAGAGPTIAAMGRALSDIAAKVTNSTPREDPRSRQSEKTSGTPGLESGAHRAGATPAETSGAQTFLSTALTKRPASFQDLHDSGRSAAGRDVRGSAIRLIAIAGAIAGIAGLFAYAGGWLTPHALTPARIADAFEQVNGRHAGFRRNHAKGVCVSGYFNSNGQGTALSKASIFQPGRIPIIGRFSLAGGQPFAADASQTVRGLGIRFQPQDGEEWRTAMINLPVFPVRTPQAFYEQLLASATDPITGKPVPARMEAFLAKYPESAKAIQIIHSHPMSSGFDNSTFNGLNAFRLINSAGIVKWARWSMVPTQRFEAISTAAPGQASKNELFDALITSIHRHPLEWHLIVTLAQPDDSVDDATRPWPPDRQQVDVGTLTIDRVESDDTSPARDINFDPLVLPNGIAASADPLLSARSAVYSQSFIRREGEQKYSSAISSAETQK
jgi:catalase